MKQMQQDASTIYCARSAEATAVAAVTSVEWEAPLALNLPETKMGEKNFHKIHCL